MSRLPSSYRWVLVLTGHSDADDSATAELVDHLRRLRSRDVTASAGGAHLPGSVGHGSLTWDITLSTPTVPHEVPAIAGLLHRHRATAALTQEISLTPDQHHIRDDYGPLVKRTLLMRVSHSAPPASKEAWLADLAALAESVPEITSWSLSHVHPSHNGAGWTHALEQHFRDDASALSLTGSYMTSGHHLTCVDTWFDTLSPTAIVDPQLSHTFYTSPTPVLRPSP